MIKPVHRRRTSRAATSKIAFFLLLSAVVAIAAGCATGTRFRDDFRTGLEPGWRIVREEPGAWRTGAHGLELRMLPGNMWGPANDARNVLVHSAPDPTRGPVEVSVHVENRPTSQYEQVDLVWYYADSHQVKIGQELVDGKLSIVMGREESDRTRTIAIIPLDSFTVDLRFQVSGTNIRGSYRTPEMSDWTPAGECDLPVHGSPGVSLQAYQGPADVERWGRISRFRMEQSGRGN